MKQYLLALLLVAFAACSVSGTNPDLKCPDDQSKGLTREEWKACYGRQDHDSSNGR